MARQNVFKAVSAGPHTKLEDGDAIVSGDPGVQEPRSSNGPRAEVQPTAKNALGKSSIRDEVKSLDPFSIRMSVLQDRMDLEQDAEQTIDQLAGSIRDHGQHVPILVRPRNGGPDEGGYYEIVYGRRRLLACQRIERPILARVRALDDEEALIAQGQENSARLNTSFIEQALFVRSIKEKDFKAEVITKATGLDKTAISRMNVIISHLRDARLSDIDLIRSIGPAHGSGRRPWEQLANLVKDTTPAKLSKVISKIDAETSDERLQQAIDLLAPSSNFTKPEEHELGTGSFLVKTTNRQATLTIRKNPEFAEFLVSKIEDLYAEWEGQK